MTSRWIRVAVLWLIAGAALRAAAWLEHPVQVDGPGYTVLSDAPPAKIAAWVRDFDERRRAAQALTGVRDDQWLPLTVLLFRSAADFHSILPPSARASGVLAVGLDQQPVIAMELESKGALSEANLRFAVLEWAMSSTGVFYDRWVMQGLYDLFGAARLRSSGLTFGGPLALYTYSFQVMREQRTGVQFFPGNEPLMTGTEWLAMHYLLIGDTGWTGLAAVQAYARRVALGEPSTLAFKGVFGLSPEEMSAALDRYAARGKYRTVKVPLPPAPPHEIDAHPAAPGLREASLARFLLQTDRMDYGEARELNEAAAARMPDDVRVVENEVLYHAREFDGPSVVRALDRAMALGTHNAALRMLWCTTTVTETARQNATFALPAPEAARVGDTVAALLRTNANRVLCYVVLAQAMPSIVPARPGDRELLETARAAYPDHTATIDAGLAAWQWRSGDAAGALAAIRRILERSDLDDSQRSFASWILVQVSTEQAAAGAEAAVAARDYAAAGAALAQRVTGMKLAPELDARERRLEAILVYARLIDRAEAALREGDRDTARTLIRDLVAEDLTPDLAARRAALLAAAGQKQNAAGAAGGVRETKE